MSEENVRHTVQTCHVQGRKQNRNISYTGEPENTTRINLLNKKDHNPNGTTRRISMFSLT